MVKVSNSRFCFLKKQNFVVDSDKCYETASFEQIMSLTLSYYYMYLKKRKIYKIKHFVVQT